MENNLILSRFWTRIWALLIDFLILGTFGFLLGLIFKDLFISLGENAKFIGWGISLIYFSVLNSKINKGQTLGKRLMKIQVVDIHGNFISLKNSFIRTLILTTPFFLNGFKIKGVSTFSPITVIQGIIIFVLGLGTIIFYIFNKSTRQSIHDIAVKTFVVQEQRENKMSVFPAIAKLPYYLTGGIFLLVICGSIYNYNSDSEVLKLVPVYEKIQEQEHVSNARISMNYSLLGSEKDKQRCTYVISMSLNETPENTTIHNPELQKAAKIFIDSNVYKSDSDILNIVVVSGYNIGIASKYSSFNFYQPISEWKKSIQ